MGLSCDLLERLTWSQVEFILEIGCSSVHCVVTICEPARAGCRRKAVHFPSLLGCSYGYVRSRRTCWRSGDLLKNHDAQLLFAFLWLAHLTLQPFPQTTFGAALTVKRHPKGRVARARLPDLAALSGVYQAFLERSPKRRE